MIIPYRNINLALIFIGIVCISHTTIKFYNFHKKKKEIINRLRVKKKDLERDLATCKKISEIRKRKPYYDKTISYKTDKKTDNEYFKIKDSIRVLQEMFVPYCTHNSMVLPNFFLVKDIIDKEIYIVHWEDYLISCKAQSKFINDKLIDIHQNKVRIAKNTTTTIKHHKYQLGKSGIDTTETIREINPLYNM